ncbi:MAG: hypothetical protein IPJ75_11260 [Ignavibacteriales bacterium]|nr:hypothetical protein [Ignavibacteriales bacterium]
MTSRGEVIPELIVFSEELGIAGTVDLLVYNPRTDKYDIYDWKTNKSIDEYGYGGKRGTRPPTKPSARLQFLPLFAATLHVQIPAGELS